MPSVSVIIPTRNRPLLLQRAIECALQQTFRQLEVVVVVDGPDPESERVLSALAATESRVRVVVNRQNVGLAESRNIGVRHAKGRWMAFLDDDDEWFPDKIEKQLAAAEGLNSDSVLVVTRYLERRPEGDRVWPENLPAGVERLSEYMFLRRGMLIPSTFLVSRALMLRVPFTPGLRYVEDVDWLLRFGAEPEAKIAAVEEACVMYYNLPNPSRESVIAPWRVSYDWSRRNRALFTDKSFAFFQAKVITTKAREAGASLRELGGIYLTSVRMGCFSPHAAFYFVVSAIVPCELKRKVRECFVRRARAARVPLRNDSVRVDSASANRCEEEG